MQMIELILACLITLFMVAVLATILIALLKLPDLFSEATKKNFDEQDAKWTIIEHDLIGRYAMINRIVNSNKIGIAEHFYFGDNTLHLVMIDALIEKAQIKLTERAKSYRNAGIGLYIFSFCVVIISALFVTMSDEFAAYIKSAYFINNSGFTNYY